MKSIKFFKQKKKVSEYIKIVFNLNDKFALSSNLNFKIRKKL